MKEYRVVQIARGDDPVVEDLDEADVEQLLRGVLAHAKHGQSSGAPLDPASHAADLLDFSASIVGQEWKPLWAITAGGMTTSCYRRRKREA